jgi:hypothetical protein
MELAFSLVFVDDRRGMDGGETGIGTMKVLKKLGWA